MGGMRNGPGACHAMASSSDRLGGRSLEEAIAGSTPRPKRAPLSPVPTPPPRRQRQGADLERSDFDLAGRLLANCVDALAGRELYQAQAAFGVG